jgi:hypothetical protein
MKNIGNNTDKKLVALLAILFSIFLIFNYIQHWNQLPNGFHNWAQSDRYSVAVKFQENFNFFKPQTHNVTSENGRCGVEFPLIQYVAARISHIFGSSLLPFVYKLLNLSILILGFGFFLKQWGKLNSTRLLLGILLFTSPVLMYYGFNFLPDTASLGLVCFGFGLLLKHKDELTVRNQILIVFVLGLATLVKTSSGIYLLAAIGGMFMHLLLKKKWKSLGLLIVSSVVMLVLIVAYDYYLFHKVNKMFWSPVFMSSGQPVQSQTDLQAVFKGIGFWHGQFLTYIQTILFIGLGLPLFIKYFKGKTSDPIRWTILFAIIGLLAFVLMMGKQFINHDYYFIASFYPLLFLLGYYVNLFVSQQPWKTHWAVFIGLLVLVGITCQHASTQFKHRNGEVFLWKNKGIANDVIWLRGSEKQLNDIGISYDDQVFVGYAAAPNTSLVYLNRNGKVFNHEEMTRDSANLAYWYERIQPDYVIIPASNHASFQKDQSAFYNRLVLFAKRPNLYIYKPI